jgi:membrane protein YqaA with SNARE-associated domain
MPGSPLKIILNYLLVQSCIIAFALPFYLLYRRHYKKADKDPISFEHHLKNFFLSRQSNWLVFFWALGEALVWFVIPEFLLLLLVFMRIHRKRELLTYDVGGTAIGTIIALCLHVSNNTIAHLPYIQEKMVRQTNLWYDKSGLAGLLYQPFSGVPYKVFTLTAHQHHFFIVWFVLFALVVRMSRYVIFFGIFLVIYPGVHKYVYKNYVRLVLVATFIFSFFLLRVVHLYR